MPSYLDLALLLIVAVSALLSMVRGFTREVLAIASWATAAVAAFYFHPLVQPYLKTYIAKDSVQKIAAVAIVFFLTLIIVSIVTIKLSEAILDSKVGALDRTLGFIFGAARGFLLGVVAFLFFNWLVPAKSQPGWVVTAKSKPLLELGGQELLAFMPENMDAFLGSLKQPKPATTDDGPADSEAAPPPDKPDAAAPERHGEAAPKPVATATTDRQKLDALLSHVGVAPAAKPSIRKP